MKTYIYILQDPITNEVRYVGKSKNPHRRYLSHLWQRPKVKYHSYYWIQKLIKKGLKPIITIIDETDDNWIWLEKYWIEQFKQWGFNLTNITSGGEGACNSSQWNNKIISCFDLHGKYIKTYKSITDASKEVKTSVGHISRCANGLTNYCKRLQWRYTANSDNISPVKWVNKIKHNKIGKFDNQNNLLECFDSINEIGKKYNNYNLSNIYLCINKKRKTYKKFIWKKI